MYGKLFGQMYDGTLCTKGPWQALVTFQQFVILADKNGEVDMTPEAISRRTTIPLEIIQQGIEALEQPDPDSRSPALEGRRIVRLSNDRGWGWTIVNYAHYRKIRSQEERRDYMRNYQRQRRANGVNKNVNKLTRGKQNQPIAVSSMQEASKDIVGLTPSASPHGSNGKDELLDQAVGILDFLNEKAGRGYKPLDANLDFIIARLKEGATVEECKAVIERKCREWSSDEKMSGYLRPATLFNRTKFAQYQGEKTSRPRSDC